MHSLGNDFKLFGFNSPRLCLVLFFIGIWNLFFGILIPRWGYIYFTHNNFIPGKIVKSPA